MKKYYNHIAHDDPQWHWRIPTIELENKEDLWAEENAENILNWK